MEARDTPFRIEISLRVVVLGFLIFLPITMLLYHFGVIAGIAFINVKPISPISTFFWIALSVLVGAFLGPFIASAIFRNSFRVSPSWIHGAHGIAAFGIFMSVAVIHGMNALFLPGQQPPGSTFDPRPVAQATVEEALGDLRFRAPDRDVYQELASRLERNDVQAATTYLMHQTGLPEPQARSRAEDAGRQVQFKVKSVQDFWFLWGQRLEKWQFLTLFLGFFGAFFGGMAGAAFCPRFRIPRAEAPEDELTEESRRRAA